MGCGASANYPNQGQQYAGQNRGGHQANRGFNNGEVSSLDSEEVLGDDNNQMGGNNQNYAPQMGHSMQNQGPGGGNFPSQLNNIPMSQTVNMGGGDGFGAGGRQVFGGKEMPEPPSSNKFTTTNNTNANQVYVESLRAFMPKDESEKPTKYVEAYQGNRQFVDNEFPPNMQSICAKPENRAKYANVVWVNPEEVYKDQDYTIFFEATGPLNIKTGHLLQNQYFVSAVSAMSEREDLISTLFPETIEADTTVNGIWLNDCGEWKAVVADNSFPADKTNGKPCFAHCDQAETWVMILEKAYAKIMGSYDDIELGMSSYALRDLTGAPYDYFTFEDPQEAWDYLQSNFQKGYILTANSRSTDENVSAYNDEIGIIPGNCYSILDLREIVDPRYGNKVRLIKMRNPWSELEWNGDWSDQSNRWTPELMRELDHKPGADGLFWIAVEDFVTEFTSGTVCKINEDNVYSSLRVQQNNNNPCTVVLITLESDCSGFISVSQRDKRHFILANKNDYDYSLFSMMVCKVDKNYNIEKFIAGTYEKDRDCEIEGSFEAGNYIALVDMHWVQNHYRQFVMSSYCASHAVLTEITYNGDRYELEVDMLRMYFRQCNDNEGLTTYKKYGDNSIIKRTKHIFGFLVFYYKNDSKINTLQETIQMKDIEYLDILPPFKDSQEFSVTVKPGAEQIVVFRTDPRGNGAFKYKTKIWNSVLPSASDNQLKQYISSQTATVKNVRRFEGQEIDIDFFTFPFKGGTLFYFRNRMNQTYKERFQLDLDNLVLFDNNFQDEFDIELAPGQDLFIKLKAHDLTKPYSFETRIVEQELY